MPIPSAVREAAVARIERFCTDHVPEDARADLRLEHAVRGSAITLVERRPPWRPDPGAEWTSQNIAQLRYDERSAAWRLHWPRHTGQWLPYEGVAAARDIEPLLAEIDADPDGVFWG